MCNTPELSKVCNINGKAKNSTKLYKLDKGFQIGSHSNARVLGCPCYLCMSVYKNWACFFLFSFSEKTTDSQRNLIKHESHLFNLIPYICRY